MRHLFTLLFVSSLALAQAARVDSLGIAVAPGEGGLVVASVDPGGFAERAGIQAGDKIVAVEREPVASAAEILSVIPKFATEVTVTISRGGAPQDLLVAVAPPPQVPEGNRQPPPPGPQAGTPPPPVQPPLQAEDLPQGVLPFLLTGKGFAAGKTTVVVEQLSKVAVSQAAVSSDGSGIAWVSAQGKLVVLRGGKESEVPMPGAVSLLGWVTESEVSLAASGPKGPEVLAVDAQNLTSRTLFAGDLAKELLPGPSCVSGYLPAAGIFARVVLNKPVCTVSFYRPDGKRHGTLQPFDGAIVACAFGPSFVYCVKGNAGSTAGEIFPAVPGLPKQASLGVTLPEVPGGFAFTPDGRYIVATTQGARGGQLTLTFGPTAEAKTVLADCDRAVLTCGADGSVLLGSGEGLFRLVLIPRDPPNLAAEARAKEAAGDRDGAETVWKELSTSFPGAAEAADAKRWLDARQRERDDEHAKAIQAEVLKLAAVERFEEAIAKLEQIRRELPGHPAADEALRGIAALQGKIEERERRKRDEQIAALMSSAGQTAASGKWMEAIRQYEAVRAQFPGLPCDAEAAKQVADLSARIEQAKIDSALSHAAETVAAGKRPEAIEEYKAIRAQFPGTAADTEAAKRIADLEREIREAAEAETARQQKGLLDEGAANEEAGRAEEAIKVYEKVRAQWPGTEAAKEAVRRAGAIEARMKETQAAAFAARVKERMETAKKLADQGDLERARQEAEAVLAADPANGDAKLLLSGLEKALAAHDEAVRATKAKLEQGLATAKGLLEAGDIDGAEKAYKEALAVDPQQVDAQVGLARIAVERRKKEVATHLALAKKRLDLKELDAAKEEYEKVLVLDPGNTDASVGLLDVGAAAKEAAKPPTPHVDPPAAEGPAFVDFAGPAVAHLGDGASTVRERLGKPDAVRMRAEEKAEVWTYASAGLVVVLSRSTLTVVEVQALGDAQAVSEGLRGRFKPFAGRTEKGVALGTTVKAVTDAYAQATKREAPDHSVEFVIAGRGTEMSFRVEGDKVSSIIVRRVK